MFWFLVFFVNVSWLIALVPPNRSAGALEPPQRPPVDLSTSLFDISLVELKWKPNKKRRTPASLQMSPQLLTRYYITCFRVKRQLATRRRSTARWSVPVNIKAPPYTSVTVEPKVQSERRDVNNGGGGAGLTGVPIM